MMKKVIFYRKIPLMVFLNLMVYIPFMIQAQSVKRQCISSYGTTVKSNNATYLQTVGQPYITTASFDNKTSILQGFQQPVVFKVEKMKTEPLTSLKLSVFPNPATSSVLIQSEAIIESSTIYVTDLNGRVIMSDNDLQLQTYIINCETWSNGIYIITVRDKNQNRSSLKLVINK